MEPRGGEQVICTICFPGCEDGEETVILTCAHQFHTACIQEWFQESATCPLCWTAIPIPQQDIDEGINRYEVLIDDNGDVYYFDTEQEIFYRYGIQVDEDGNVNVFMIPID